MRYVWCTLGAAASILMLACSMRMNFLYGSSFGQSSEKALLFGSVSIVADLWKGVGPVLIGELWRRWRVVSASTLSLVWVACFAYAIASAIGFASQDRAVATGARENTRQTFSEIQRDASAVEARRSALRLHRPTGELEARLEARLATPVVVDDRIRGTVGSVSGNCVKPQPRTIAACNEVRELREELAVAAEAKALDEQIVQLRVKLLALREQGGTVVSDPQGQTISMLSRGFVSVEQVHVGITLLIGAIVELVSAFGLSGVAAYAEATRMPKTKPTGKERHVDGAKAEVILEDGGVLEYLAERICPGSGGVSRNELYTDYLDWCSNGDRETLNQTAFLLRVDQIREEHGLISAIRKFGDRYYGIALREGGQQLALPSRS
jgi:hypothetical protein